MDKLDECYKILGVTSTTPFKEVQKKYRELMLKHHPDHNNGSPEEFSKANELSVKIIGAYTAIKNLADGENVDYVPHAEIVKDIMKWFPKIKKNGVWILPRQAQENVLVEFERLLYEGKRKFIICAPTGTGKSYISKCIANYFASRGRRTLITSPLNTLVDQYKEFERDYIFPMKTLKGRNNYKCNAYRRIDDTEKTCDEGLCKANICTQDYVHKKHSRVKIYNERHCGSCDEHCCPCKSCAYKQAYLEFTNNLIGNTNFTLLQMDVTNEPYAVIVDESDDTESSIRMFRTVTVQECWRFESIEDHLSCLIDRKGAYEEALAALEITLENIHARIAIEDEIGRLSRLIVDIKEGGNHTGKYVISDEDISVTKYRPIAIDRFIDKALKTKQRIVILMSATPQKIEGWEYIEVPSSFSKSIRPFKYVPIGSMTLKNRDKTIPKLAQMLVSGENLLKGKTIVHVASYEIAGKLGIEVTRLSKGKKKPIVQTTKNSSLDIEGTLRSEVIEKFKRSSDPEKILIAVNMGRGVDLHEKDILNNVITYVKRQNPTDHLVKAKWCFLGKEWEYEEAANEVMQQYGRVNRNDQKTTNTIITEPEWVGFFKKHKQYFRNWFIEAIV